MKAKVGINGMGRIGRMVVRAIVESNNKDISPQSVFAHSNKDPKTLDQNKIDRFYKCSGYKLDIIK